MFRTVGFWAGFAALAVCAVAAPSDASKEKEKAAERLTASREVLSDMMNAGDKGIPRDLLERAQCVVVVPGLKKGAFLVGAEYGKGFMTCRKGDTWSDPAGITVVGGSFGFQAGATETDLIMFAMSKSGADHWMGDQFTLGAAGAVAAGPIGRHVGADTDAKLSAEILSWSRAHGLYAGVDVKGATLKTDRLENTLMYGHDMNTREVIESNAMPTKQGRELISFLQMYPPKK